MQELHYIKIGVLLSILLFAGFVAFAISQTNNKKQQKEIAFLLFVFLVFFGSMLIH